MVCPTCGIDNDPSAVACARCNTALAAAPVPSPQPQSHQPQPYQPQSPRPQPYQLQPPHPRPSRALPLIAGLAVVVLAVLVAGVVLYRNGQDDQTVVGSPLTTVDTTAPVTEAPAETPTDTQPPVPTEKVADPLPQAKVIDALLVRSGASRTKLNRAIKRVGRCSGVSGALADMRAVGEERRAQISAVKAADLAAVDNGESLRSNLVTALQHSLDADAAFVEWAEAAGSSCPDNAARRADYDRGMADSDRAGTAKEAFLAQWNPVATGLGLPARTRLGI